MTKSWIKYSENVPPLNEEVLVNHNGKLVNIAKLVVTTPDIINIQDDYVWSIRTQYGLLVKQVSPYDYWMNIPKLNNYE